MDFRPRSRPSFGPADETPQGAGRGDGYHSIPRGELQSPKGSHITARGEAPGTRAPACKPCKGGITSCVNRTRIVPGVDAAGFGPRRPARSRFARPAKKLHGSSTEHPLPNPPPQAGEGIGRVAFRNSSDLQALCATSGVRRLLGMFVISLVVPRPAPCGVSSAGPKDGRDSGPKSMHAGRRRANRSQRFAAPGGGGCRGRNASSPCTAMQSGCSQRCAGVSTSYSYPPG